MKIDYYSSTNEILKEIGTRIKSARIDAGLSQQDLAEQANVSIRTISNIEHGRDTSFATIIEVMRGIGRVQVFDSIIPETTLRPSRIVSAEKPRSRVSRNRQSEDAEDWKWGDER